LHVVDDSNKCPEKTILCVLRNGFDKGELMSLKAVEDLVDTNGAYVFRDNSLSSVASFINKVFND